ncbi:MAG TPA: hypothetical protein VF104_02500 [Burkholderiales bacterium]
MMKRFLFAAMGLLAAASAFAANVGVTVTVGEPGFYGTLDINNYPQPQIVYTKPVVIQPVPVGVVYEPVYLYVPPGHAKHWKKHCYKYNACDRPVYFVKEKWYKDVYVPQYREQHGHGGDGDNHGKGGGKGHGKGKGHKDD